VATSCMYVVLWPLYVVSPSNAIHGLNFDYTVLSRSKKVVHKPLTQYCKSGVHPECDQNGKYVISAKSRVLTA
jgi:hypothetical protein